MLERRHHPRRRVYLGGRNAFHRRTSTMDCIVRNFTPDGARVEMNCPAAVPDLVDLTITSKGVALLARVVWRRQNEAGLGAAQPAERGIRAAAGIALRIRDRARNRMLRNQVEQLRSER